MAATRYAVGLLVLVVMFSGCGMSQGGSSAEIGSTQLPARLGTPDQVAIDRLRADLLAFADLSLAEMEGLGAAIESSQPTPDTRAFVQGLRADVASTTVALAVEPDSEAALQSLMVSMAAKRAAAAAGLPAFVDASTGDGVEASLTRLEKQIWDVGTGVYSAAELEGLRGRVALWWDGAPSKSAAGVLRASDLPGAQGAELSKGLFAPINEANRQIEEARLLGERFLFLAERLPTIAIWQAEAAAWSAMATPDTRAALEGLISMASTLERLALRVDSLPLLLDSQREAFLSAFDTREGAMDGLLRETGEIVRTTGPIVESGERIAELSPEILTRLNRTLELTDELLATLRNADAPGGAVSLDVNEYGTIVSDLRAAAEALSTAVANADGLAEAPRAVIDHATWRGVQLIFLLFGLAVAYRIAMPMVQKRIGPSD